MLECSGKFRTPETLTAYFQKGVRKVIVAAPVKQDALNVVVGVHDHLCEPDTHDLLTAVDADDPDAARDMLPAHPGLTVVGDKGYSSAPWPRNCGKRARSLRRRMTN